MIEAVIFDSDGVLVNTDQYHYLSWKAIADKEGIYFDSEINNQMRGISREDSLNVLLKRADKEYTLPEKEALLVKKNDLYQAYLAELTPASAEADVASTLNWLKKKGIKLAVGSSSKSTRLVLEKVDLLKNFDAIVTGEDVKAVKPSPDIFNLCAEKLGIVPNHCLVVEDGVSGIKAAKAGGFVTCGISEASNYYQTDYPIKNISDVMLVVTKINKNLD